MHTFGLIFFALGIVALALGLILAIAALPNTMGRMRDRIVGRKRLE